MSVISRCRNASLALSHSWFPRRCHENGVKAGHCLLVNLVFNEVGQPISSILFLEFLAVFWILNTFEILIVLFQFQQLCQHDPRIEVEVSDTKNAIKVRSSNTL